MKATQRDIDFALLVVKALDTQTPGDPGDLYWESVRREKKLIAALYQEAADVMQERGEWYMPSEAVLAQAHEMAWADLKFPSPAKTK